MGGASQPYKHVHECREEGGRQKVRTCADELVQTDLTLRNSVWSVWACVCVCVCVCVREDECGKYKYNYHPTCMEFLKKSR